MRDQLGAVLVRVRVAGIVVVVGIAVVAEDNMVEDFVADSIVVLRVLRVYHLGSGDRRLPENQLRLLLHFILVRVLVQARLSFSYSYPGVLEYTVS